MPHTQTHSLLAFFFFFLSKEKENLGRKLNISVSWCCFVCLKFLCLIAETSGAEATSCAQEEEEEEFDWQMEQQLPNKEEEVCMFECTPTGSSWMTHLLQETQLIGAPSYGFANQQKGVFSKLQVTKFCLVAWVREGCPIYTLLFRRRFRALWTVLIQTTWLHMSVELLELPTRRPALMQSTTCMSLYI